MNIMRYKTHLSNY